MNEEPHRPGIDGCEYQMLSVEAAAALGKEMNEELHRPDGCEYYDDNM